MSSTPDTLNFSDDGTVSVSSSVDSQQTVVDLTKEEEMIVFTEVIDLTGDDDDDYLVYPEVIDLTEE